MISILYKTRRSSLLHAVFLVALSLFLAPNVPARDGRGLSLREGNVTVRIPPLAKVFHRNSSGKSWGLTGRISGTLEIARGDFGLCLSRQGWRWHTVTSSDGPHLRMALVLLKKGPKRLMLMLWEAAPGQCGFSLGEDYETLDK